MPEQKKYGTLVVCFVITWSCSPKIAAHDPSRISPLSPNPGIKKVVSLAESEPQKVDAAANTILPQRDVPVFPRFMQSVIDSVRLDFDPKEKRPFENLKLMVECAHHFYNRFGKYPRGIRDDKKRYRFVLDALHDAQACFDHRRHIARDIAKVLIHNWDQDVAKPVPAPIRAIGQCYCPQPVADHPYRGVSGKHRFRDCFPEDPRVGKLDIDPKKNHGNYQEAHSFYYYRAIVSFYLAQLEQTEWYMVPIAQMVWAFANAKGPLFDPQMRRDLATKKPRLGKPYAVDESTKIAERATYMYAKPCWYDLSAMIGDLDGFESKFKRSFSGREGRVSSYLFLMTYTRKVQGIRSSLGFVYQTKDVQHRITARGELAKRLLYFDNVVDQFQKEHADLLAKAYQQANLPIVNFVKLSRKQALSEIESFVKATHLFADLSIVRARLLLTEGLRNLSPKYIPSTWAVPFSTSLDTQKNISGTRK